MIVPAALKILVANKVVAVGAGAALVAGGLAVASPQVFLLEPASETADAEVVDDPEGDDTTGEAPADGGDTDVTEAPSLDDQPETDPEEETLETEVPEEEEEEAEEEKEEGESGIEAIEDDEDADDDDADSGPSEQGLANRSETANRVQEVIAERKANPEALTGREFGEKVSEAARGDRETKGNEHSKRGGNERSEERPSESSDTPVVDDTEETTDEMESGDLSNGAEDSTVEPSSGKGNRPAHAGGPKG